MHVPGSQWLCTGSETPDIPQCHDCGKHGVTELRGIVLLSVGPKHCYLAYPGLPIPAHISGLGGL